MEATAYLAELESRCGVAWKTSCPFGCVCLKTQFCASPLSIGLKGANFSFGVQFNNKRPALLKSVSLSSRLETHTFEFYPIRAGVAFMIAAHDYSNHVAPALAMKPPLIG
ncbi:hypothetical protein NPIL_525961 [Nephila pilipes]|uniref:Uncharacterized protein n=1 Tax=Nephila pilipes TaxID=299642 RepID=A0A8X6Q204_NEPPI|nr:hypothetical protein NPIL_525961 [Nephila pilipes]